MREDASQINMRMFFYLLIVSGKKRRQVSDNSDST